MSKFRIVERTINGVTEYKVEEKYTLWFFFTYWEDRTDPAWPKESTTSLQLAQKRLNELINRHRLEEMKRTTKWVTKE